MSLLDELEATESVLHKGMAYKAYLCNLLNKKVIKLPYSVSDIPNSEVDYYNNHIHYDGNKTAKMRLGVEFYTHLRKILIETNDTDSLFYKTYSGSPDFYDSFCKAREMAAYGDYCLLKLWTGTINNCNELYLFSNVYPSMLMSIQLCQTKFSLVDELERPQFVSSRGVDPEYFEIMEYLGQYSKGTIKICPQKLTKAIDRINALDKDEKIRIEQEDLFIIVYLHELAHAMLDLKCEIKVIQNDSNNPNNFEYKMSYEGDNNGKFYIASSAMEESLANMIMLKYIEKYAEMNPANSDLFEKAKYFVRQQCGIYSFGYYQFCIDADWTKWRDYKEDHPESNDQLEEWYNRCFRDGEIIISLEGYSNEMFDRVMCSSQN